MTVAANLGGEMRRMVEGGSPWVRSMQAIRSVAVVLVVAGALTGFPVFAISDDRTALSTAVERELRISELQRQIDVATGKMTPEQARQAAETERFNVLTTEVERLRKTTGSLRSAQMEDVSRLRQLSTELRQLGVATGKMTPQQAEKAAADDKVALLRAEQNAVRNGPGQSPTKGDRDRDFKLDELQRQIDVATGKKTQAQADAEKITALTAEVERLRKETGSPRTASMEEVRKLQELSAELRRLEVAAGRMTPQQAEQAAAGDKVALLRGEQNVLRNGPGRGEKDRDPEREFKIRELQRQIDVATGKMTPAQARQAGETDRLSVLTSEVERLRKTTGSRITTMEEVKRLQELLAELRQLEVATGKTTQQQAENAAAEDKVVLLRAELNALRNQPGQGATRSGGDRDRDLKIADLQRQIDVATGKITPAQAEAQKINALTAEVERLRKEISNPRTASMEELNRLREILTELRRLEVAAGRMTPQQAEQAAREDGVALLRGEQNALRNEAGRRGEREHDPARELKVKELQLQIDVATGKLTPAQAQTEKINALMAEVERLRKETGSARTADMEEVERLRQLLAELRQLEVAAGRMTPQQAEQAVQEDRVALARAELNALLNERGNRKGSDPQILLGKLPPNFKPPVDPLRKPSEPSPNRPVGSPGSAGSSGYNTVRNPAIDRLSGDGMGGGVVSTSPGGPAIGRRPPTGNSAGSSGFNTSRSGGSSGTNMVKPSGPFGGSGSNTSRSMGSSGTYTINSQSGNAPARSSGPDRNIDYGGCAGCGRQDTFRQPR
jgi:nitroimidazol reductase NimA-like FMN-containing flavoprotein (pyridoxamine 5'-phosphate oxidase superfamily)